MLPENSSIIIPLSHRDTVFLCGFYRLIQASKLFMKILLSLLLFLSFSAINASQHDIAIKKFKFTPAEITIVVGDSIRWTNKEKRQYHSVWFEKHGDPEPDYFFPGEFFERTFNNVGDFSYRCGPHPKMTGIVHVKSKAGKNTKKNSTEKSQDKEQTTYLVESVEDGDTIVINYKGKTQRVQLIGIDAPEGTQNPKLNIDSSKKDIKKTDLLEMGRLSTEQLKVLVAAGQKVSLSGNLTQKDKYDRLPAIVINEKGESLNQQMVETGYALLLTRFPISDKLKTTLETAQEKAKTEEKGLWKSHLELMKKWSN